MPRKRRNRTPRARRRPSNIAEKIAPGAAMTAEKVADPGKALRDALETAAPEAALAGAAGHC